jgi:hypothetical protein
MTNVDLNAADSARFREVIANMKFAAYRRVRARRLDKPLSYFEPMGFTPEELRELEARFQREAQQ